MASGVKGLIKQIEFHSYQQVSSGYSHPLPSTLFLPLHLSPIPNTPSIPHGNVRQATVSALLRNL